MDTCKGLNIQWEICFQTGGSCLLLCSGYQRLILIQWHPPMLGQRKESQCVKESLDIFAIGSAYVPHSGICDTSGKIPCVTRGGNLPVGHAESGRGIILASTSVRPSAIRRFLNRVPTRRSFDDSKEPIYRVLHSLSACFSVIEPLSDWTLKYISTSCTQPPGFRTLSPQISGKYKQG